MAYGPQTTQKITKISSGEMFTEAGNWQPDDFTVPFPQRLAEHLSAYHDIGGKASGIRDVIRSYIKAGAEKNGVKISRNTIAEWLSGGRDPSVSSSDANTRENIYKLCAALDYDYEMAYELFEKVFFTRPFNPKSITELAYFYFARRDYENFVGGCRWYQKGRSVADALFLDSREPTGEAAPITDSRLIVDRTQIMDEAEFIRFLSANPSTFSRQNQYVAARKEVLKYAQKACSGVFAGWDPKKDEIPYDKLINHILGYSQRSVTVASGSVAALRFLPAQLTTNFPTGQILRKICSGDVCSYDQIYKMLCLLLFYCYFSGRSSRPAQSSFRDFLRFSNISLDRVGCAELYPCQAYGGLILFCAAQQDPIDALQSFILHAAEEESEAVLQERLTKAVPGLKNSTALSLVRAYECSPFLVNLTASALSSGSCTADTGFLMKAGGDEDRICRYLLENAGLTEAEMYLLRCFTYMPSNGITERLFSLLADEKERTEALSLAGAQWIDHSSTGWRMDYRIRSAVTDLMPVDFSARKDCSAFFDAANRVDQITLSEKEIAQIRYIIRKMSKA